MPTSRLEAFSDGVLAIVITIMVLALKVPTGDTLADLWNTAGLPLLTYVLSFAYVGIYWNNHHHLLQIAEKVDGRSLWANLLLLFWLSLLPFTTGWMDDTHLAAVPVAVYGVNLLAAALAYVLLEHELVRAQGPRSRMREALGREIKGKVSLVLYSAGIAAGVVGALTGAGAAIVVALGCFVLVAFVWLAPDRRIERSAA